MTATPSSPATDGLSTLCARSAADALVPSRAPAAASASDIDADIQRALSALPTIIGGIIADRLDQITQKGHTAASDDAAPPLALCKVAGYYLNDARDLILRGDPELAAMKLTRAAALIVAEIDRQHRILDRQKSAQ